MTDHRILRAKERYGVSLTLADIAALEAMLSPANCFKAYGHELVHVVRHAGTALVAAVKVIDGRQLIATFLPPDAFSQRRRTQYRKAKLDR